LGKGIINSIPKFNTTDPLNPLNYRGKTLASTIYKLYCSVINERFSSWLEDNSKLVDKQNGIVKKRSTGDNLSSITSFIETSLKKKLCTFAAFIDKGV
jgi:hypothetical protein